MINKSPSDKFLSIGYFKSLIITMVESVKIDEDLLKRIDKLVKRKDKKIKYAHKKQFVNMAVLTLLEKEENNNE